MSLDPFPDRGHGSGEPDGSPLPPVAGEDGPAEDGPGLGQGLYVCLPAGQVTLEGFAQGGEADTMAPGALLAAVVDTVTGEDGSGLGGCSDDQLMGIISAARRMEARAAWTLLAAVGEFAGRPDGSRPADEFAADELGFQLHLTWLSAGEQMRYAAAVARRLPGMFALLGAGLIHPVHLRIAEDETGILSDEDAAKADAVLAGQAPGLTFGEMRAAARKLVLKLDPEAVRKRKEAARRDAQVRRFREASGNAGLVARELPSDEVLASWQHVEQRALDLRAAGMPGTLQELRVRAYLDLLQERDSRDQPAAREGAGDAAAREGAGDAAADQPPPDSEPSAPPDPSAPNDSGPGTPGHGHDGPGRPGEPGAGQGPEGPGGPGTGPASRPDAARRPGPATGPSLAALVTLTIPWATLQGQSDTPGEADGFGLLDGDDARDLAAAAARHPATRWCLTALNPDGTAAAHGCLPGRHPPPPAAGGG